LRTLSANECRGNQNTFSSNAFYLRIVPVTNYKRYGLTRYAVEEPTQFGEKEIILAFWIMKAEVHTALIAFYIFCLQLGSTST
jgi:hypothetical protein